MSVIKITGAYEGSLKHISLEIPKNKLADGQNYPNFFSFNAREGACPTCEVMGRIHAVKKEAECRLNRRNLYQLVENSDWVIDLGPDGGDSGGRVMFEGTPEETRLRGKSITAKYLHRDLLQHNGHW